MAKSKTKLVGASTVELADMPKYMSLDLEADELNALKDTKVGSEVILIIKGTLVSMSQDKRKTDNGTKHTGHVRLEDFDVELGTKSMWAEMADADD